MEQPWIRGVPAGKAFLIGHLSETNYHCCDFLLTRSLLCPPVGNLSESSPAFSGRENLWEINFSRRKQTKQKKKEKEEQEEMAFEGVWVMMNGLSGKMGLDVAAACLRKGFRIAPYAMSGSGSGEVSVADPKVMLGKFFFFF